MEKEKNVRAYLALFAIYIIWGTTYLAIRIGVKDLQPIMFAGLRWLIAGPILLIFLKARGYDLPKKKDLFHLTIIALALLGVGNGLVVFAEQSVPSGLTALLITTVPFWMVGFESLRPHGKKLNLKIIGGLFLGLIGVALIFGSDIKHLLEPTYLIGIIGLMVAVVGWSAGSIYSKHKKSSVHPLMGAAVQMIIAGIVLTILALCLGEFSKSQFTMESFYAFSYLIVFGSLIGYASYIYAIAHLPVSLVSTYAYINPIIALFLGWLILDESINASIAVGALIILGGVMLVKKGSE